MKIDKFTQAYRKIISEAPFYDVPEKGTPVKTGKDRESGFDFLQPWQQNCLAYLNDTLDEGKVFWCKKAEKSLLASVSKEEARRIIKTVLGREPVAPNVEMFISTPVDVYLLGCSVVKENSRIMIYPELQFTNTLAERHWCVANSNLEGARKYSDIGEKNTITIAIEYDKSTAWAMIGGSRGKASDISNHLRNATWQSIRETLGKTKEEFEAMDYYSTDGSSPVSTKMDDAYWKTLINNAGKTEEPERVGRSVSSYSFSSSPSSSEEDITNVAFLKNIFSVSEPVKERAKETDDVPVDVNIVKQMSKLLTEVEESHKKWLSEHLDTINAIIDLKKAHPAEWNKVITHFNGFR